MLYKNLVFIIVNFALIFIASLVYAAQETGLKVTWKEVLIPPYLREAPTNLQDFSKLLKKPWTDENGHEFHFDIQYPSGTNMADKRICNCTDLMVYYDKMAKIETDDVLYSNVTGWRASCEGMRRMPQMRNARVSYIDVNVQALLGELSQIRPDTHDDFILNNFLELKDFRKLECPGRDVCYATTKERLYTIVVAALGDFNHDGIQDIMIFLHSNLIYGAYQPSVGIIVTRLKAGSALQLLDWW